MPSVESTIEELLKPLFDDLGYELWGCEYRPQGAHSLLRVYIDKPDGIGVEDCEKVSREISALLDVEDPISSHYALEVSSPGIPRPLFYHWQYQRYLGESVQIKLYQPLAGKRKYEGKIVSIEDNVLKLTIEDNTYDFPLSNIVKANLIVE